MMGNINQGILSEKVQRCPSMRASGSSLRSMPWFSTLGPALQNAVTRERCRQGWRSVLGLSFKLILIRCIVPSQVNGRSLHSISTSSELYSALVDFVHYLYFKWLLVNPKDRRVVIVENVLGPTLFRETLAKVLFRHYEVSSVLFVPSHLVCLFSLGVRTGLVVDCGHKETTAIPVGCPDFSSILTFLKLRCMKVCPFWQHGKHSRWQARPWKLL